MLRRHFVKLVLAVDLVGLLVLDGFLIVFLYTDSGDSWHRLRQEMVLLLTAAVILDVPTLLGKRWAMLLRMGIAFGIATTMATVFRNETEPMSITIAIYQAGLILVCGWQFVRRWA